MWKDLYVDFLSLQYTFQNYNDTVCGPEHTQVREHVSCLSSLAASDGALHTHWEKNWVIHQRLKSLSRANNS